MFMLQCENNTCVERIDGVAQDFNTYISCVNNFIFNPIAVLAFIGLFSVKVCKAVENNRNNMKRMVANSINV